MTKVRSAATLAMRAGSQSHQQQMQHTSIGDSLDSSMQTSSGALTSAGHEVVSRAAMSSRPVPSAGLRAGGSSFAALAASRPMPADLQTAPADMQPAGLRPGGSSFAALAASRCPPAGPPSAQAQAEHPASAIMGYITHQTFQESKGMAPLLHTNCSTNDELAAPHCQPDPLRISSQHSAMADHTPQLHGALGQQQANAASPAPAHIDHVHALGRPAVPVATRVKSHVDAAMQIPLHKRPGSPKHPEDQHDRMREIRPAFDDQPGRDEDISNEIEAPTQAAGQQQAVGHTFAGPLRRSSNAARINATAPQTGTQRAACEKTTAVPGQSSCRRGKRPAAVRDAGGPTAKRKEAARGRRRLQTKGKPAHLASELPLPLIPMSDDEDTDGHPLQSRELDRGQQRAEELAGEPDADVHIGEPDHHDGSYLNGDSLANAPGKVSGPATGPWPDRQIPLTTRDDSQAGSKTDIHLSKKLSEGHAPGRRSSSRLSHRVTAVPRPQYAEQGSDPGMESGTDASSDADVCADGDSEGSQSDAASEDGMESDAEPDSTQCAEPKEAKPARYKDPSCGSTCRLHHATFIHQFSTMKMQTSSEPCLKLLHICNKVISEDSTCLTLPSCGLQPWTMSIF